MCQVLEDMRNEAARKAARKTAIHLVRLGKMTPEEIAEATELSLNVVKDLERQSKLLPE